ncbi:cytochrome D1 domain-containing protein [Novosphingobium sp.]|uniref:cytochrome D1 domain-containing protein n=1 Tax=Novosphingobium sp. TaxID=1874826 RepID=UPI00333F7208
MRNHLLLASLLLATTGPAVRAQSLVVINQGTATASVIDARTFAVIGQIDEHQPGHLHAHEVAVSPDGRTAYLPVYGDTGLGIPGADGHELLFVDLPTRRVTGSVDFGHGVRPHLPQVDPATGLVYVTTELDNSVTLINPKTRAIIGSIPTGAANSHMLVLSHDGRFGYTANVKPGSVSVLDLKQRKLLAVIPVTDTVQRIAISADDRLIFTSDNMVPRLAVMDTATRGVREWIALPGLGHGAAATPDGRWLLVAMPALNQVAVIDLTKRQLTRTIAVGKAPQAVLIPPGQKVAYVSCGGAGMVAAVDLGSWKVIRTVATAYGADGMAWAAR